MGQDLDDMVLSFLVQVHVHVQGGTPARDDLLGTLDPANSKFTRPQPAWSTLELKHFGQYVCVSATDDSAKLIDLDTASAGNCDSDTAPNVEAHLTPHIGSLGDTILRSVVDPGSCPPSVLTPIRVHALLALVRSTALQRPQVQCSIPYFLPCTLLPVLRQIDQ